MGDKIKRPRSMKAAQQKAGHHKRTAAERDLARKSIAGSANNAKLDAARNKKRTEKKPRFKASTAPKDAK